MYSFSDSPFFLARKGGASQQRSSRVRNRVRPFHRSKSPLARFSSPLSIAARTFSKTSRASASNFARFASGTAIRPASIMLPSFLSSSFVISSSVSSLSSFAASAASTAPPALGPFEPASAGDTCRGEADTFERPSAATLAEELCSDTFYLLPLYSSAPAFFSI